MALLNHKLVQDSVRNVLANNFNSAYIESSSVFGVDPIALDFSTGSQNVIESSFDPADIELSALLQMEPAGMAIYTGPAEDTGKTRASSFDGPVIFHVCGVITVRQGAEGVDTQSIINCYEGTVWGILNAALWAPPLRFTRETRSDRSRLVRLSDGFRQWFDLSGKFELTLF